MWMLVGESYLWSVGYSICETFPTSWMLRHCYQKKLGRKQEMINFSHNGLFPPIIGRLKRPHYWDIYTVVPLIHDQCMKKGPRFEKLDPSLETVEKIARMHCQTSCMSSARNLNLFTACRCEKFFTSLTSKYSEV